MSAPAAAPKMKPNPAPLTDDGAARSTQEPHASAQPPSPTPVDLMGIRFFGGTEAQCIDTITALSTAGQGGWVVTPNVDILRRLVTDDSIRKLTEPADLLVADGMPLIWASRLQGTPLPERVCGSNLILSLSNAAAKHSRTVFLLGGDPGTAESAKSGLESRYPGIKIVGTHCPPFGFEADDQHYENLVNTVVQTQPDVVFVALGFPRQERVIARLRSHLPNTWFLGVGISFSFVTGQVRRAPKWMQKTGLEWVHRLLQEPRRLIRRYLIDDIPFALRLLYNAALKRRRNRSQGPVKSG